MHTDIASLMVFKKMNGISAVGTPQN